MPDSSSHLLPGTDEGIETPGALMSGFKRSESGVGPDELKLARLLPEASGFVTAATVIAPVDVPGEIKSLNVSNAAALALYVASRQLQST